MEAEEGTGVGVGEAVGVGDGVVPGVGVGVGAGCDETDPQPTIKILRNMKANGQSRSVGLNFK